MSENKSNWLEHAATPESVGVCSKEVQAFRTVSRGTTYQHLQATAEHFRIRELSLLHELRGKRIYCFLATIALVLSSI